MVQERQLTLMSKRQNCATCCSYFFTFSDELEVISDAVKRVVDIDNFIALSNVSIIKMTV